MRKIILSIMVSLDGYIEGPGRNMNWHVWDDEMNRFMGDFFKGIDTLLLGRVTFELMKDFWPNATGEDLVITGHMNNLPKIVFSRTLENPGWNSRLIKEKLAEEMAKLKQQKGQDMVMFRGADLAASFMRDNLFDQYNLIVNPVVLGAGTPLFKDPDVRPDLNFWKQGSLTAETSCLAISRNRKRPKDATIKNSVDHLEDQAEYFTIHTLC